MCSDLKDCSFQARTLTLQSLNILVLIITGFQVYQDELEQFDCRKVDWDNSTFSCAWSLNRQKYSNPFLTFLPNFKVHWCLIFYPSDYINILASQFKPFRSNKITTGWSWLKLLINNCIFYLKLIDLWP